MQCRWLHCIYKCTFFYIHISDSLCISWRFSAQNQEASPSMREWRGTSSHQTLRCKIAEQRCLWPCGPVAEIAKRVSGRTAASEKAPCWPMQEPSTHWNPKHPKASSLTQLNRQGSESDYINSRFQKPSSTIPVKNGAQKVFSFFARKP